MKDKQLEKLVDAAKDAAKNIESLALTLQNERLKERLEVLEQENKILKMSVKDTYDTGQEIIGELTQENEKLKKAIEIIKNKLELEFNLDEYWKGVHYHLWSENGCEITQQEYELLKEVLGND